jgi:hypothetical protein
VPPRHSGSSSSAYHYNHPSSSSYHTDSSRDRGPLYRYYPLDFVLTPWTRDLEKEVIILAPLCNPLTLALILIYIETAPKVRL